MQNAHPISGATSSTFVVGALDVGRSLRVLVTARNGGGSGRAVSAATGVVSGVVLAPGAVSAPVVSGAVVEGETLFASAGSWSGSPASFGYQWEDCSSSGGGCVAIAGASSSAYVLGSSDVGHSLRVLVTAANSAGSASQTSAATGVVQAASSGSGECSVVMSPETGVAAISRVIESAAGGSVVCLKGGTYSGTFEIKGGASGPRM